MARGVRSSRTRVLPVRRCLCVLALILCIGWIKSTSEVTVENSCERLGVTKLEHLEPREDRASIRKHDGFSWKEGFFPFEICKGHPAARGTVTVRNTAVLVPFDKAYAAVMPEWSRIVKSAGLRCFVLALDDVSCRLSGQLDCDCIQFHSPNRVVDTEETESALGWHPIRIAAVQTRFRAAEHLLGGGYDVIMHDADVFFNEDAFDKLKYYITSVHGNFPDVEILAQDNGFRPTAYDRINWGFVWMKATSSNSDLMNCTLSRWSDAAFSCLGRKCDKSYFARSQPRINHIIEESLKSSSTDPKICLVQSATLNKLGIRHMTGYTSALSKQLCAKARGFLRGESLLEDTVAFDVPANARPSEQRSALLVALAIGRILRRKVEIPEVFHLGEKTDFCLFYHIQSQDIYSALIARTSACSDQNTLPMANVLLQPSERKIPKHVCLHFDELLTKEIFADVSTATHKITLCDPTNNAYASYHMCQRQDGQDEVQK